MRRFLTVCLAAATLTACGKADMSAQDAWVRLPAVPGRPAAAYVTIQGGGETTSLMKIATPAANRTELHEMKSEGGMMTMSPLDSLPIPAGETVKLAPGGAHAMLFDVAPTLRAGGTIPLRLSFANGRTIEVAAKIKAAGEAN